MFFSLLFAAFVISRLLSYDGVISYKVISKFSLIFFINYFTECSCYKDVKSQPTSVHGY